MNMRGRSVQLGILAFGMASISGGLAWAGGHTWRPNEIFSDCSGTIQFIEIKETGGGNFETCTNCYSIFSNTRSFPIGHAAASPTAFKTILFATPACAALPGMPTPDYIIPAGSVPFFSIAGDDIKYGPYVPTLVFGSGVLPTDGVHSLNADLTTGINSPKNYAGATGTVIVCALRGDIDGNGIRDGADIAGFVRVVLGTPAGGDRVACAEYCTGTLAGNIAAFVADLLS